MTDNVHIIMRQSMAVNIPNKQQYAKTQYTVEQALKRKLFPLLDQIFSEYVPQDVVIKIDQLKVDIGTFAIKEIEESLAERIRQVLPPLVKEKVAQAIHAPHKAQVIPLLQAKLKAIQHYLEQGYFAWWMPQNTEQAIEAVYVDVLNESAEALQTLWSQIGQTSQPIRRFVTNFTPTTVKKSIQLHTPVHSKQIITTTEDLTNIQRATRLIAIRPQTFEKTIWEIVFSQVIEIQSTPFNETVFVKTTLEKLSSKLPTNYRSLVLTLAKYFEKEHTPYKPQSNLPTITTLLQEALLTTSTVSFQEEKLPTLIQRFDQLLAQDSDVVSKTFVNLWEQILSKTSKTEAKALCEGWIQEEKRRDQWIQHLSHPLMRKLIKILKPSIAQSFAVVRHVWDNVLAQAKTNQAVDSKFVERTTLHYLSKRAENPAPQPYLTYLFHEMPSNLLPTLQNVLTTTEQHQEAPAESLQVIANTMNELAEQEKLKEKTALRLAREKTRLKDKSFSKKLVKNFTNEERAELIKTLVPQAFDSINPIRQRFQAASLLPGQTRQEVEQMIDQFTFAYIASQREAAITSAGYGCYLIDALAAATKRTPQSFVSSIQEQQKETNQALDKLWEALSHMPPLLKKQKEALASEVEKLLSAAIQDKSTYEKAYQHLLPWIKTGNSELDSANRQSLRKQTVLRLAREKILLKDNSFSKKLVENFTSEERAELIKTLVPQAFDSINPIRQHFQAASLLPGQTGQEVEQMIDQLTLAYIASQREAAITSAGYGRYLIDALAVATKRTPQSLVSSIQEQQKETNQALVKLWEAFSPMLLTLKKQEEALASEVEKLLSAAIQDKSTYEKAYQHLLPWIKTCNSELDSTSRQSLLKQLVEELEACGHDAKKVEQVMEKIQTHQPTSTGLSLYKALYKVVPPKTAAQYYFALVPLVTRVIKEKLTISSIDKQIHPMIDKIVSPLTGNKIKINEVVKKFVRQIENASSIEKDWQHFLQTGTLRAQYTSPHVLLNAFVEHASSKTKPALKHLLQASSARKRIVAYFSDSDLRKLVPIIEEKAHQQITTCIYTMLKLHHHTPLQIASKQDFRNVWWEVILQKLAETDRFLQETWLAESLLALADTLQLNPRTLLYSFVTTAKEILPATQERANLQMSQLAANLSALIENKEASIQKDLLSTTHKTLATIVEELEQAGSVASPLDNKKEKQKQPPALEKLTPKQEEPEEIKIYIQNGGIIFLWPFLEKLFEAQGLLEEGAFIDEITLNNAIHTMEYMATGRLYTPEEVLALNKILCGLTHDTVISSRYILREEEDTPEKGEKEDRQEATETSAEALQEEETEEKDKVTKTDASQERTTDEQTPIAEKQQPEEGNTTQTKEKLPEEIIRLQKQCAQTIESVMEQWESLEELEEFKEYEEGFTAEDFKAYILKRQGILRKIKEGETHYWHLSLAIKTYDSRELKPPWRIEKIKLPWMKETLVVFWIPG